MSKQKLKETPMEHTPQQQSITNLEYYWQSSSKA